MDYQTVLKAFRDIWMADPECFWVVGALTLVIFVIMRAMLPVKSLSLVFAPAIFWGGLAGIYAFREMGLVTVPEKMSNVVVTATFGMIAAMVVMIVATRIVDQVTRIRRPLTNTPQRARI